MYNRSEIMKKAWGYFRNKMYSFDTFGKALAYAWSQTKREIERDKGLTKASELKAGDTVLIEYGAPGNKVVCVITGIRESGKYYVVSGVSSNGLEVEFCAKLDGKLKKVEQCQEGEKAAAA